MRITKSSRWLPVIGFAFLAGWAWGGVLQSREKGAEEIRLEELQDSLDHNLRLSLWHWWHGSLPVLAARQEAALAKERAPANLLARAETALMERNWSLADSLLWDLYASTPEAAAPLVKLRIEGLARIRAHAGSLCFAGWPADAWRKQSESWERPGPWEKPEPEVGLTTGCLPFVRDLALMEIAGVAVRTGHADKVAEALEKWRDHAADRLVIDVIMERMDRVLEDLAPGPMNADEAATVRAVLALPLATKSSLWKEETEACARRSWQWVRAHPAECNEDLTSWAQDASLDDAAAEERHRDRMLTHPRTTLRELWQALELLSENLGSRERPEDLDLFMKVVCEEMPVIAAKDPEAQEAGGLEAAASHVLWQASNSALDGRQRARVVGAVTRVLQGRPPVKAVLEPQEYQYQRHTLADILGLDNRFMDIEPLTYCVDTLSDKAQAAAFLDGLDREFTKVPDSSANPMLPLLVRIWCQQVFVQQWAGPADAAAKESALKLVRQAAHAHGGRPPLRLWLGELLMRRERTKEAVPVLLGLVEEEEPVRGFALNLLLHCAVETKDAGLLRDLARRNETKPSPGLEGSQIMEAALTLGETGLAKAERNRQKLDRREWVNALNNAASAEAILLLLEELDQGFDEDVLRQVCYRLKSADLFQQQLAAWEKRTREKPDDALAWFWAGLAWKHAPRDCKTPKGNEADFLKHAVELAPENLHYLAELSRCWPEAEGAVIAPLIEKAYSTHFEACLREGVSTQCMADEAHPRGFVWLARQSMTWKPAPGEGWLTTAYAEFCERIALQLVKSSNSEKDPVTALELLRHLIQSCPGATRHYEKALYAVLCAIEPGHATIDEFAWALLPPGTDSDKWREGQTRLGFPVEPHSANWERASDPTWADPRLNSFEKQWLAEKGKPVFEKGGLALLDAAERHGFLKVLWAKLEPQLPPDVMPEPLRRLRTILMQRASGGL